MNDVAPRGLPDDGLPDDGLPDGGLSDPEQDAAFDAAVRARLANEVAAWSAERSGRVQSDATDLITTTVKSPVRAARQASKRAPKPGQPKAAPASSKPFSMSYDGVTPRQYMDQVIARGTR